MGLGAMRIRYDPVADAAFVDIVDSIPPGGAPHSYFCDVEAIGGTIILLFSPEDRFVGVEILEASHVLPPEVLKEVNKAV
jgi:uncharacterized protein YuzE